MSSLPAAPSRWQRLVQLPPIRFGLGFVWVLVVVTVVQGLIQPLAVSTNPGLYVLGAVAIAAAALLAYATFVRAIERRLPTELAPQAAAGELALGALVGALLFSLTIGGIALLGYYRVTGVNGLSLAAPALAAALVSGVLEEILFRGLLFRIAQEALGTGLALVISALVFGLLHLLNPNASLVAALAIALEAGVMLAAAYLLTNRLWLSMGIHFAWNFTQGGIFGAAVSGQASTGLLRSGLQGPVLLTGGAFGAEASVVAVLVCGLFGAYLVWRARRAGKWVRPFWQRGTDKS